LSRRPVDRDTLRTKSLAETVCHANEIET